MTDHDQGDALTWTPGTSATPTRLTGAEKKWIQQALPGADDTRKQVQSGPMHSAVHLYASASTVVASLLVGHARPDTASHATPGARGPSGPADPVGKHVEARIDRIDRAMQIWAHCFSHCPLCPDIHRPHDRTEHLGLLVDTAAGLVDNIMATSIISPSAAIHIAALNVAQQTAAMQALDQWKKRWGAGAEPDTLRHQTRLMSELAKQMQGVAKSLGAERRHLDRKENAA